MIEWSDKEYVNPDPQNCFCLVFVDAEALLDGVAEVLLDGDAALLDLTRLPHLVPTACRLCCHNFQ